MPTTRFALRALASSHAAKGPISYRLTCVRFVSHCRFTRCTQLLWAIPAESPLKNAGIARRVTYDSRGHMTAVAHYMLPLLPTACHSAKYLDSWSDIGLSLNLACCCEFIIFGSRFGAVFWVASFIMLLHTHIHALIKHGKTFSKNTIAIVQWNSIPTIVTKILFYKVAVWEPNPQFHKIDSLLF